MKTLLRRPRLPVAALSLLLVVLATACGFTTGSSGATGTVSADKVGFSPGGMLVWEGDASLGHDLDDAAATGAKWMRLDVNWSAVQQYGPSDWQWAFVDHAVNAIRGRGMSVLMVLDYTPAWARQSACSTSKYCPPANPGAYGAFAGAAAARYGPMGVHAYEIWNEPNWAPWWIGAPDAPAYVALLKAAYPAIHAADSSAVVVTGGLAPHGDLSASSNDPINPVNYLKAMYAAGAHGSFDAFGVHPYPPLPFGPLYGSPNWNTFLQTSMMHEVMTSNGDGAKTIWGTEFGAATGGTDPKVVSESAQAQFVADGVTYWASLGYTGPLFIHSLRDSTTSDPTDWSAFMGVTRLDYSAKPSFNTLRTLVRGS